MLSPRWRRVLWGVQPAEPTIPEPVDVWDAQVREWIDLLTPDIGPTATFDIDPKFDLAGSWRLPVAPMRYPSIYDETRATTLLPDIEADIAAAEVAFRELVNA